MRIKCQAGEAELLLKQQCMLLLLLLQLCQCICWKAPTTAHTTGLCIHHTDMTAAATADG
jgi:hypothetical protein